MSVEREKYVEGIEAFLNHNLNLKYITLETTVEELLGYLTHIKTTYIRILKEIEDHMENPDKT